MRDVDDLDEVTSLMESMPEGQVLETTLRLTTLAHEFRHFHDFLLTPYGNHLVRDSFWYSCLTFCALTEVLDSRRGGSLSGVALPVDPRQLPIYGDRMQRMRSAFHGRAKAGRSLMEASAILIQTHDARLNYGDESARVLTQKMRSTPDPYSRSLNELEWMRETFEIDEPSFTPVGLTLILMRLLDSTPGSINEITRLLVRRVRGVKGRAAFERIMGFVMAAVDGAMRQGMRGAQLENEKFLETLDTAVPSPLRDFVVPAFADFASAAADVQRRFLEDPPLLLNPNRYLNEGLEQLVTPFVYLMSDGRTTMQAIDRSWEHHLNDPLSHVLKYEVEGERFYELRCVPAPVLSNTLNAPVWKRFASAVAGSLVIAEGADRDHPVEGMWLQRLEEELSISFTPFGLRSAWDEVPAGEYA